MKVKQTPDILCVLHISQVMGNAQHHCGMATDVHVT